MLPPGDRPHGGVGSELIQKAQAVRVCVGGGGLSGVKTSQKNDGEGEPVYRGAVSFRERVTLEHRPHPMPGMPCLYHECPSLWSACRGPLT